MASLRIISYNVNGIRAAIKKGLVDWLKTDPADIICLQETKAEKDNVDTCMKSLHWAIRISGSAHRKKDTAALLYLQK